jgi:predicted Zn-dependent protease
MRNLAIILSSVLLILLAGCAVEDRQVISQAANTHKSLSPTVMDDPELSQYIQAIGDRIIQVARLEDADQKGPDSHFVKGEENDWMFSDKMKFHLVNSKTVNAFTTGGEHMYIYNAAFQLCDSEDELAAVMSHEYAHVYCRHVAQGQQHAMTTLLVGAGLGAAAGYAIGGDDNRLAGSLAGAGVGAGAGQFVNMGFTRKDESQADEYGFKFYTQAGWDPRHFADFFRQMIKQGFDTTPAIASDHPTLKSRVEAADKRVAKLGPDVDRYRKPPIADAQKFAELKQRAARLAASLPDDTTLANSRELLQALPRSCVVPVDPPDAVQARKDLASKADQKGKKKKKKQADDSQT